MITQIRTSFTVFFLYVWVKIPLLPQARGGYIKTALGENQFSWLERKTVNLDVGGSSPSFSAIKRVSSVGRTREFDSRCHRFESCTRRQGCLSNTPPKAFPRKGQDRQTLRKTALGRRFQARQSSWQLVALITQRSWCSSPTLATKGTSPILNVKKHFVALAINGELCFLRFLSQVLQAHINMRYFAYGRRKKPIKN